MFYKILFVSILFILNGNILFNIPFSQAENIPSFNNEDELNFYCLKKSYPKIKDILPDSENKIWIILEDGTRIPYADNKNNGLDVDVRTSMEEKYSLEPDRHRPEISPGRKRPYNFLKAIYGSNSKDVQKKLIRVPYLKKSVTLVENAARAFEKAIPVLKNIKNEYSKFLKLDGSYYWRNIAGENVLSAHSFGIAIDLGADHAPYWRWSRKPYHPLQTEYPPEIVEAMESNGFIWGGKWKEYDIMHFEYRPELICKSKILSGRSF